MYPVTPTLSVAVMVVIGTINEPDVAGTVNTVTVGGVVSVTELLTVTMTPAEVAVLPAASLATAVRVCEALVAVVVFQETL
jgi:hypothetical protein